MSARFRETPIEERNIPRPLLPRKYEAEAIRDGIRLSASDFNGSANLLLGSGGRK